MINIGDKYNRLTVLGFGEPYVYPNGKGKERTYICLCECGNIKTVRAGHLKRGAVKSCGCLVRYMRENGLVHRKHGGAGSRLYIIWKGMRQRCHTTTATNYSRYGGRGITICEEWDNFGVFAEWALLNGYSDTLTLDRIDPNGNYTPNNCRWVTYREQANNMRSNHMIQDGEQCITMAEYCRKYSLKYKHFWSLIKQGISVDEAARRSKTA